MPTLRDVFVAIACKRLVRVDLPGRGSHQHELNGVSDLRALFGTSEPVSGTVEWHYFADGEEPIHETGQYRFYDARARGSARTGRSEWRLYYSGNFLATGSVDDLFVLARTTRDQLHALVMQSGSSWERAVVSLFDPPQEKMFRTAPEDSLQQTRLEFVASRILEELGFDVDLPAAPDYEERAERELHVARQGGLTLPAPSRMTAVAREIAGRSHPGDPDETLLACIDAEEHLFRAIERRIVEVKLRDGFTSVDDFIKYSLTVHNRRKSRMGLCLQNHLAAAFREQELRFTPQCTTENRKKPDFIFPGSAEYHDPAFPADHLTMLAAKSTLKDRWTQILPEAARIPRKHLCTLEPSLPEPQTAEIVRHDVVLVVPARLHSSYTPSQRAAMLTLSSFLEHVSAQQRAF